MTMDAPIVSHDFFPMNTEQDTQNDEPLPAPGSVDEECDSIASSNSNEGKQRYVKLKHLKEASQLITPLTAILLFILPMSPRSSHLQFRSGQAITPPLKSLPRRDTRSHIMSRASKRNLFCSKFQALYNLHHILSGKLFG